MEIELRSNPKNGISVVFSLRTCWHLFFDKNHDYMGQKQPKKQNMCSHQNSTGCSSMFLQHDPTISNLDAPLWKACLICLAIFKGHLGSFFPLEWAPGRLDSSDPDQQKFHHFTHTIHWVYLILSNL